MGKLTKRNRRTSLSMNEARDLIQAKKIINSLQNFTLHCKMLPGDKGRNYIIEGQEFYLTQTQVNTGLRLLSKRLPDLSSQEIKQQVDGTVTLTWSGTQPKLEQKQNVIDVPPTAVVHDPLPTNGSKYPTDGHK